MIESSFECLLECSPNDGDGVVDAANNAGRRSPIKTAGDNAHDDITGLHPGGRHYEDGRFAILHNHTLASDPLGVVTASSLVSASNGSKPFTIELLGGLQLLAFGVAVSIPPQARRLVAFLAMRNGAIARRNVADRLWADRSTDAAQSALRSSIWQIEKVAPGLLLTTRSSVSLDREHVTIDLEKFGLGDSYDATRTPLSPSLCERGELLPEMDEEWLVFERERCRLRRVHLLERSSADFRLCGRYADAIDAALAAIAAEPLRESAHRVLVDAHIAQGNAAEAHRAVLSFCDLHRRELGFDPSPAFRLLIIESQSQ